MSANPLISRWRAGQTTYGVWCTMPNDAGAEFIAQQGVDYVCVDYQHGLIDHGAGVPMIRAIEAGGSVPIVRVAWNEPHLIMQALDAGARGVVVPMVNTAEDARRAVRALKYPPHGERSYGPVRARMSQGTNDPAALAEQACIIMIETAEGLKNVREIAATPGVDALYIGPSDLALALGLLPNHSPPDPQFVQAIADIEAACRANGVAPGIQCATGAISAEYTARGFNMITIVSDVPLLTGAVREHLAAAKGSGSAGGDQPVSNY